MELRTCKECKRLFNYWTGDIVCPECKNTLEEKFDVVKEYLTEHKETKMAQVAKDCGIALSQIKQWVREERIHLSDERDAYSRCEKCGSLISIGQFCNECKNQLLQEVGDALNSDISDQIVEKVPKKASEKSIFKPLKHSR